MTGVDESAGHAFLSYVREDRDRIQKIVTSLQAADVPVYAFAHRLA